MNESLVLEKPNVFPTAPSNVVNRLIRRAAGRTGEPAAGFEFDLVVDSPIAHVEFDVFHRPGFPSPRAAVNGLISDVMASLPCPEIR